MVLSTWNVKEGDNVSCWLCEHFQRYDSSAQPTACEGECRKNTPEFMRCIEEETVTDYFDHGFFTFVPFGNIAWCSGFQRSLEENIPPNPGSDSTDCDNQMITDWILPQDFQNTVPPPFSKKPILESCWYCTHWQRATRDPVAVPTDCSGWCQIKPPLNYFYVDPSYATQINNVYTPVWILYGPQNWCARWERNPDAANIPDPPDIGSGPCVVPV